MAMPLTCPRGHQWNSDEQPRQAGKPDLPPPICPICGLAPVAAPAAIPPTLVLPAESPPPSDTTSNRATLPRADNDKKDQPNLLIPQHIPGYEILGELGRGGMGIVYKARQAKLNRIVALKMILAGAQADPLQMERFRAEAEAVARLQHPYIVQIHEISDYNGCPFFSLEYVDGGNLAQKLNGVPQPPRLAAAFDPPPRLGHTQRPSKGHHSPRSQARQHSVGDADRVRIRRGQLSRRDRRRRFASTAFPRSPISAWPSISTSNR